MTSWVFLSFCCGATLSLPENPHETTHDVMGFLGILLQCGIAAA
jgi:hypothetical protein